MRHANALKSAAIVIAVILALMIPALFVTVEVGGQSTLFWAGLLSIILGAFSFVRRFILIKRERFFYIFYQLLLFGLGALLLIPSWNAWAHTINTFADSVIAIIYLLMLLIILVIYRKHIDPENIDVSHLVNKAEQKKKRKKKKQRTEEY